jgi:hypothetical protein
LDGDLLDSSGNGNHAQARGDARSVSDAQRGTVLEFDGNGDYLEIPNSASLNITGDQITLASWVYFEDVAGDPEIVIAKPYQDGSHVSPYFSYGLHMLSNGTPRFWLSFSGGARNAPGSPNFQSGRWYHMAGVYDGAQMILYVDGEVSATTSATGNIVGYDNPLLLGINGGRGEPMEGKIDEVAIFDRALPQAEIQELMAEGLGDATLASAPVPGDEQGDVPRETALSWSAGELAGTHDVYLGTIATDIDTADRANPSGVLVSQGQAGTTYAPPAVLEFGQTYYWRVDEVNATPDHAIFKGELWSFTVEPFAYPIENVIATSNASSTADAGPENTVNGSGLNANDEHSIEATDMWLATPTGADPVYIQYEFDGVYKQHEMWVWNYNVQFEIVLGFGLKEVAIEYSQDGVEWMSLGAVEFAKATATASYTANTTVDMQGVAARYVRLTVNSGWGALGQYGLSEVRFLSTPVQPREPQPADGAADVTPNAVLSWRSGREAASHEVYLGTDAEALELAGTVTQASLTPGDLEFGTNYYWRVDEVNEAEAIPVWQGAVWSFSTVAYAVIDDMEGYDDEENRIFDTWLDGFVNATGSTVGYFEAPFAEQSVVNSGRQSMPMEYANDTAPFYSEAERDLSGLDIETNGADTLRLFVAGQAPAFAETADGTILMNAIGTDIWNTADEFRYAYKTLSGDGSMVARVDSLVDSDVWAKGGVMIRETIEAGSAFAAVYMTGDNGVRYQARLTTDAAAVSDTSVATAEQIALREPVWVKIERVGNAFNGYYSTDGESWTAMAWNPQTIDMANDVTIGLALTSHNATITTGAAFAGVAEEGGVSGNWQIAEVGVAQPTTGNDIEPLYVALEDTSGNVAVVTHPNPAAAGISAWQEWLIPYSDLAGINLNRVAAMYIGVGDRDNPTAGGTGLIFIDDIGYGRPATVE